MIKRTLFFSNPAYLKLKQQQLFVEFPYEERKAVTIPIEDIGIVLLEHEQITISHPCLNALVENNVAVITCNAKKMPSGMLLPLDGAHTQTERFRYQMDASVPLKKQLWQQTIQQKITNQAQLLEHLGKDVTPMHYFLSKVNSGDTDNMEARAAVYYWSQLFEEQYPDFKRDRDGVVPNNLLNYGYAILRSIVARALVSSGLLPTLGIFHRNKYNAYCLADDIMEPYRPFVDYIVCQLINEYDIPEELNTQLKSELVKVAQMDVLFDNKTSPLLIGVSRSTASLAKCFMQEARKIVYPKMPI